MKVKVKVKSCLTLSGPMDSAFQALPSMGFSRQEYWSGVPLPSPKWDTGNINGTKEEDGNMVTHGDA